MNNAPTRVGGLIFDKSSHSTLVEHDPRLRGDKPFPKTGIHFSGSCSSYWRERRAFLTGRIKRVLHKGA